MESHGDNERLICDPSRWVRWTWLPVSITTCWNPAHLRKAPFDIVHIDSLGAKKVGWRAMSLLGYSGTETITIPRPSKWLLTPAPSSTPILRLKSLEKYFRWFATNILVPLSSRNNINLIISGDNPWTGLSSLPAHHRLSSHPRREDLRDHAGDYRQE